ncbi:MAG TPA: molybdenum cofactor guanylyltransferase [Terriglobales bacterium]|nr:molybdenum cofactor guanylyltransferase [Terriglobales bacterium]
MNDATAFILAGGRSSRMGSDKALLSFGGQSLLQRTLQAASSVTGKVFVLGPKERYGRFGDVIEDVYKDCGPLAGIHAALSTSTTDLNLMLSVDMPLMTADFLRWLMHEASVARELIVVPDALGGPQPLCAVYRREVRGPAELLLKRGEYKISNLFTAVPTRYISEREVVGAGFSAEMFSNINTPAEYEHLRAETDHNGLLKAKS